MSKHDELCHKGADGQWWDMSCNCDYIATVKNAERERIIELLNDKKKASALMILVKSATRENPESIRELALLRIDQLIKGEQK